MNVIGIIFALVIGASEAQEGMRPNFFDSVEACEAYYHNLNGWVEEAREPNFYRSDADIVIYNTSLGYVRVVCFPIDN